MTPKEIVAKLQTSSKIYLFDPELPVRWVLNPHERKFFLGVDYHHNMYEPDQPRTDSPRGFFQWFENGDVDVTYYSVSSNFTEIENNVSERVAKVLVSELNRLGFDAETDYTVSGHQPTTYMPGGRDLGTMKERPDFRFDPENYGDYPDLPKTAGEMQDIEDRYNKFLVEVHELIDFIMQQIPEGYNVSQIFNELKKQLEGHAMPASARSVSKIHDYYLSVLKVRGLSKGIVGWRGVLTRLNDLKNSFGEEGMDNPRYQKNVYTDDEGRAIEDNRPNRHKQLLDKWKTSAEGTWNFLPYMEEIARIYESLPHEPNNPQAQKAWRALADDSVKRAAQLGQQHNIKQVQYLPYETPEQQDYDVKNYNQFQVSELYSDHDLWTVQENVAFRTVHDLVGHLPSGGDFSWEGENRACGAHFPLLNNDARIALFTECIGQTAYVQLFGKFSDQKISIFPNFDPQKGYIPQGPPQEYNADSGLIYRGRGLTSSWQIEANSLGIEFPDSNEFYTGIEGFGSCVLDKDTEEVYFVPEGKEHSEIIFDNVDIPEGYLYDALEKEERFIRGFYNPYARILIPFGETGTPQLWMTAMKNSGLPVSAITDLNYNPDKGVYYPVPLQRTSKKWGWQDYVAPKAKRLKDEGRVQLLRNGVNHIVAQVRGDNATYQVEIDRLDPNSMAISGWSCECPWYHHAFGRTLKWKKYEGRLCSHAMATFWQSQASPLDDEQEAPAPFEGAPMPGASPPSPVVGPPPEMPTESVLVPPDAEVPPGTIAIPGTFSKVMREAIDDYVLATN